ncbi:MAG: class I SAM-dependent methyltransferase [Cyanobacteria bacterium P01_D01_bin.14]
MTGPDVPRGLAQVALYGTQDLAERKRWYSSVAQQYHQARPRYPQWVIEQVVQHTGLGRDSRVLEVGCGPGTATLAFAPLGCRLVCLEPSTATFELARQNCAAFEKVEFINCAFEEWPVEAEGFDAVLAATSFHWVPASASYPKAAAALKPDGHLILLWNKGLYPSQADYPSLAVAYQEIAPHLDNYEDEPTQLGILNQLGQPILDSGLFENLQSGHVKTDVVYTTETYLMLLGTYSPYLKLAADIKASLFARLAEIIDRSFGGELSLSYITAYQIAQKTAHP